LDGKNSGRVPEPVWTHPQPEINQRVSYCPYHSPVTILAELPRQEMKKEEVGVMDGEGEREIKQGEKEYNDKE
jgi:hypothetical protein